MSELFDSGICFWKTGLVCNDIFQNYIIMTKMNGAGQFQYILLWLFFFF